MPQHRLSEPPVSSARGVKSKVLRWLSSDDATGAAAAVTASSTSCQLPGSGASTTPMQPHSSSQPRAAMVNDDSNRHAAVPDNKETETAAGAVPGGILGTAAPVTNNDTRTHQRKAAKLWKRWKAAVLQPGMRSSAALPAAAATAAAPAASAGSTSSSSSSSGSGGVRLSRAMLQQHEQLLQRSGTALSSLDLLQPDISGPPIAEVPAVRQQADDCHSHDLPRAAAVNIVPPTPDCTAAARAEPPQAASPAEPALTPAAAGCNGALAAAYQSSLYCTKAGSNARSSSAAIKSTLPQAGVTSSSAAVLDDLLPSALASAAATEAGRLSACASGSSSNQLLAGPQTPGATHPDMVSCLQYSSPQQSGFRSDGFKHQPQAVTSCLSKQLADSALAKFIGAASKPPAAAALGAAAGRLRQHSSHHRPPSQQLQNRAMPVALDGSWQPGEQNAAAVWLLRTALLEDELQGRALEVQEQLQQLLQHKSEVQATLLSLQGCGGGAGTADAIRKQLLQQLSSLNSQAKQLTRRAAGLGSVLAMLQGCQQVLGSASSGTRRLATLRPDSRLAIVQLVLAEAVQRLPGEQLQQLPVLRGLPGLEAAADEVGRQGASSMARLLVPHQSMMDGSTAAAAAAGQGGWRPVAEDEDAAVVATLSLVLSSSSCFYTPRPSLALESRRTSLSMAAPAAGRGSSSGASNSSRAAACEGSWSMAASANATGAAQQHQQQPVQQSGPQHVPCAATGTSSSCSFVNIGSPAVSSQFSDDADDDDSLGLVTAVSVLTTSSSSSTASKGLLDSAAAAAACGKAAGGTQSSIEQQRGGLSGATLVEDLLPPGVALDSLNVGELLQLLTAAVTRTV